MLWFDPCFDYPNKNGAEFSEGTESLPRLIAYLVPDSPVTTNSFFTYIQRNAWGRPTNIIDTYSVGSNRYYRTNTFVYDSNGRDLLHHYGPSGTDPWNSFSYTADHQLENATNRLGEVTSYTYDSTTKNVATITFPNDLVLENELYSSGDYQNWIENIYLRTADSSVYFATNTFTYSDAKIFTHKDPRGLVVTNYWDDLQRLTGVAFPDGTTLSNRYDLVDGGSFSESTGGSDIMDLTATKDRLDNWTYFTLNALRQVTAVTNALDNVTSFEYCECGLLSTVTDALTNTTTFNYDSRAFLTSIDYPGNHSVTNSYNLLGWLESATDALGGVTNTFNLQGLVTSSDDASGEILSVAYDIEDRPTEVTDANGVQVDLTYDDLGRIETRVYPDGGTNTLGYTADIAGPTSFTDPLANVVSYGYDALGRLTNMVYSGYATNKFTYRPAGEIATLTDGKNQDTTWSYDEYGRLLSKVDNSSSTVLTNAYDAMGRLTTRWTPEKGETDYAYDDVGNLTAVNYPTSADLSFDYDASNRLTNAVVAGTFTNAYSYTGFGAVEAEDGPWADDTVSYAYDNHLRESLSLLRPSASAWTNGLAYDGAHRLEQIVSQAGTFDYTYDSTRKLRPRQIDFPSSIAITNSFDSVARLAKTYLYGQYAQYHSYAYNAAGQRTVMTNEVFIGTRTYQNYAYDSVGQLIQVRGYDDYASSDVARAHQTLDYVYDAAGNLQYRTNNALAQTFTMNELNQATNITRSGTYTASGSPGVVITFNGQTNNIENYVDRTFARTGLTLTNGVNSYTAVAQDSYGRLATNTVSVNLPSTVSPVFDDNGNLTGDGIRTFTYDDENQLTHAEVADAWRVWNQYDALGRRRVRREYTLSGSSSNLVAETRYIYDGRLVIQERNGSNVPLISYTRGLDLSGSLDGAGGIGGLLARTDHSGYSLADSYYFHDGNGNVSVMLNSQGQEVARYVYDSFGNMLGMVGWLAEANPYRFSGKEYDDTAGLYYYGFRFYEPNLQRWLNQDPMGEEGGINLYGFVLNSPVNAVDRDGLDYYGVTPPWSGQRPASYYYGDTLFEDIRAVPYNVGAGLWNTFGGIGAFLTNLGEKDPAIEAGLLYLAVRVPRPSAVRCPPSRINPQYTMNEAGLTVRAEGTVAARGIVRGKGYRPEPVGGRAPGDHRGHLLPEAGFENPKLVNIRTNIISEAPGSNLGIKKVVENFAIRLARQNPNSIVNMVTEPIRATGQSRPFAVTVWVTQDGRAVYGVSVLNR